MIVDSGKEAIENESGAASTCANFYFQDDVLGFVAFVSMFLRLVQTSDGSSLDIDG